MATKIAEGTRQMHIKPFDVQIMDNDRINVTYPCGHKPQAVFVQTGHGATHATWTLIDDFERHCYAKGKARCQKCVDTISPDAAVITAAAVKEDIMQLIWNAAAQIMQMGLLDVGMERV